MKIALKTLPFIALLSTPSMLQSMNNEEVLKESLPFAVSGNIETIRPTHKIFDHLIKPHEEFENENCIFIDDQIKEIKLQDGRKVYLFGENPQSRWKAFKLEEKSKQEEDIKNYSEIILPLLYNQSIDSKSLIIEEKFELSNIEVQSDSDSLEIEID